MPGAGNPQQFNRYSYVGNNPLSYIDPTGHMRTCEDSSREGCGKPFSFESYIKALAKYQVPYQASSAMDSPEISYSDPLQWDNPRYEGPPLFDAIGFHAGVNVPVGKWASNLIPAFDLKTSLMKLLASFSGVQVSVAEVYGFQTYGHGAFRAQYLILTYLVSLPRPTSLTPSAGMSIGKHVDSPDNLLGWSDTAGVTLSGSELAGELAVSKSRSSSAIMASYNVMPPGPALVSGSIGVSYAWYLPGTSPQFLSGPIPPCAGMAILPNGVCGAK